MTEIKAIGKSDKAGEVLPLRTKQDFLNASLTLWFGPKKIAVFRIPVQTENYPVDPFTNHVYAPPDLSALPPQTAGVWRPSEPINNLGHIISTFPTGLRYVERSFRRRFIDLTTDFENYLSKFSGKTRSTLKRKVRKFQKASGGKIDWTLYRTPMEMDSFHSLAREVSKRTYQEKLFDAGIPDSRAFLDEMRTLAGKNLVRSYILSLDGKPISYLYCPIDDGRVLYRYLGFDPACANHSPGTVLQMLALEQLFSEKRYRFFDFTEGDGEHKRLFSTESRLCASIYYLKPTPRNVTIVCLHRATAALSDRTVSLVERMGLKTRLRQILRGQRTPINPHQ